MKTKVQEAIDQADLAERVAPRLRATRQRPELAAGDEERGWLAFAEARLVDRAAAVRVRLEEALALPELKSLRVERRQRLEQEWLSSARTLFNDLVREVGENSPLVQALFPHQRFEKLERGGAALESYVATFKGRRGSTYVRRLAADAAYPFLPGMLAPLDQVTEAVSAFQAATDIDDAEADGLRAGIAEAAEALGRTLQQARALSEAALIDEPELLRELAFNERPSRRPARQPAERTAD